ncbi:MAG: right-handed parallel beta-helix repeat-containing protein [Acidimicrobiia bacterium]
MPTVGTARLNAVVMIVLCLVAAACSDAPAEVSASLPSPTTPDTTQPSAPPVAVPGDTELPIEVPAGADLGALVEDAEAGATFLLGAGVHRGHSIEPKDGMTFEGVPGTTLNGARVLEGFQPDEALFRLDGVEWVARNHGQCVDDYEACALTQDLFMDDVMLWQVESLDEVAPGTWFWSEDTIWVADDPSVRRVELSEIAYAFVGDADDVTIAGLTVEKYATPAQEGAVQAQRRSEGERGSGWRIESVEAWGNHGAGIRTGDDTVIVDSYVHHNGQLGITISGGTNVLIESTEIAFNNTAGFVWQWEAGGLKATNCTDVTMRDNSVHDNNGPGLWADLDCMNVEYVGNTVTSNDGPGIFHEISGAASIHNNDVRDNGHPASTWLWGAGILVAGSSDTEVFDNVVLNNGNAIAGIQQDRGEGTYGPRLLMNLNVHDNIIEPGSGRTGIVQDVGDDAVFESRNNRFTSNTYLNVRGRAYEWLDRAVATKGWTDYGNDVDGTWIQGEFE